MRLWVYIVAGLLASLASIAANFWLIRWVVAQ